MATYSLGLGVHDNALWVGLVSENNVDIVAEPRVVDKTASILKTIFLNKLVHFLLIKSDLESTKTGTELKEMLVSTELICMEN